MGEPKQKETTELTEFEKVDLEFKKMQIAQMREAMKDRDEARARLDTRRAMQVSEYKKGEAEKARRQSICKHRKGGRNNKFAAGDGNQFSINKNTYPDGKEVMMCTRCWKEVEKPHRSLRKSNPKLFEAMWAEWVKWNEYPTDNSPSGGKLFEFERAA